MSPMIQTWIKVLAKPRSEVISVCLLSRLLSSGMLCSYLEIFHLVEFTEALFKILMVQRHEMLLGLR